MTHQQRLALLTLLVAAAAGSAYPAWPAPATTHPYSVICHGATKCSLSPGRSAAATGWGTFSNQINSTGWSVLDVHTNPASSGADQAFAAGFLEGALTAELITVHAGNVWSLNFNSSTPFPEVPAAEADWVGLNLKWMAKQAAEGTSSYQNHTGYLLAQLRGLAAGYNDQRPKGAPLLSELQIMMLSLIDGDLGDVQSAIGSGGVARAGLTHCSAMVKRLSDGDVLIGHTNWDSYISMLRIVKHFEMPLPGVAAVHIVMDSYPGVLYSETDFYRTSAGLTITETSLDNENAELWSVVNPKTMLQWARSMLANRLASTGDEWTEVAGRFNSGTCNNQWIVLDTKKIVAGTLPPGTLWIAESMPGHTERADITIMLNGRSGFWFSFNIPYFSSIASAGGYNTVGDVDFWKAPREQMFERMRTSQHPVDDLESFVAFLRYNNRSDPLAGGDACNGISARCDLNPHMSPRYHTFGAQDVKVALGTARNSSSLEFHATLSPTWDGHLNPPFAWSVQKEGIAKPQGHPDVFDFSMYTFDFAK